jgi:serine-type D-Ala-D-Ala carboxypeptidase/endopeptidase (penicillin-binding protein 4)
MYSPILSAKISNSVTKLLFSIIIALLFISLPEGHGQSRKSKKTIHKMLFESAVFQQGHSGFMLFDPQSGKTLEQMNADKYFTPASNTKIFTLYSALNLLGDSLPVFHYIDTGDTLIFWGAGNPAFLHPDLPADTSVVAFLRSRPETLCFTDFNFRDDHFGPGWAWSDYSEYYQPERAPFPIYGNIARIKNLGNGQGLSVSPKLFADSLRYSPDLDEETTATIRRHERSNIFEYNSAAKNKTGFQKDAPFHYSAGLFAQLLSDTLRRSVSVLDPALIPAGAVRTIYMPTSDSLYMRLMRNSDNFVAEQLLLMASDVLFNTQNSRRTIEHVQSTLLRNTPDPIQWWDGSGLSRYNAFTPRTIVHVLNQLMTQQATDRLLQIFPAGGANGTIRGWYGGTNGQGTYVYAKTGSLRYVHCLSGFVRTKKDRLLIFSFMHNNFTVHSDTYKKEMQKVLSAIHDTY